MRKLNRWWREKPIETILYHTSVTVFQLQKKHGGPYSYREVMEIVADVLELDKTTKINKLTRQQCHMLITRLIVRSMI